MTPLKNLKGQQKQVAQALLKHGYIDRSYALMVLKVQSLNEIVRRLREWHNWPIETNKETPERLYTLRRTLRQDARLMTTAINEALNLGDKKAARTGALSLLKRIDQGD